MTNDPVFARNPKEAKLLAGKHVLQVGLGSLGSVLALQAARAGVVRLTLVDNDVLSLENVGRHMLSRPSVGKAKVLEIQKAIEEINPKAEVRAIQKDFRKVVPARLFEGKPPDLLVGATDSFLCHSLLNSLSLAHKVPAVYVGVWGEASMGEILYVIPGQTPCYECYAGFRRKQVPVPGDDTRRYTDPDFDGTKVPAQAGLWPNILTTCGVAFQVMLALLDPEGARAKHLIDDEYTLLLVNVSDYDSPLQPLTTTFGRVEKGCAICDESKLRELGRGLPRALPGNIGVQPREKKSCTAARPKLPVMLW